MENPEIEAQAHNNIIPESQKDSPPSKERHNSKNSRSRSDSPYSRDHSNSSKSEEYDYKNNEYNSKFLRQKDPNAKNPVLDFLIFISTSIKDCLLSNKIMDSITAQIGGITMEFDNKIKIPEYNGCLLRIKGNDIKKKRDATQQLLEFIVNNDLDHPNEPKKTEKIAIIIMIPNGLVSMIIGTRGKQISNLINESKASIIINQPIYKMTYRTVTISGYPESIANGIMSIQKIMEERYNEVQKIEFESPPLNVTTTQTTVKIILNESIIDYISNPPKRRPSIKDELQKNYEVSLSISQDKKNRQIERKDYICTLKGTIEHVQKGIIYLSDKIKNDIKSTYDGKESYQLKILINKVFVTKLIGAQGCMIQEIANFAKGASIKIMSSKNEEKKGSFHDIPLCVAGNFMSVQDATCIIIEQMECFKNGGPVLKSGKSLHENIAQQFMNSIFTNAARGQNEDEHIYTLKERFSNNQSHIYSSNNDDRKSNSSSERKYNPNRNPRRFSDHSLRRHSRSRSRSRERYWDKQRKGDHSYERSRSRSRDRDNKYYNKDKYDWNNRDWKSFNFAKDFGNKKFDDFNNNRRDIRRSTYNPSYSAQFSYFENNSIKISIDFTVPDHLVSKLIGKNGENVRGIMNKTGAIVNFSKEYNDEGRIHTQNGIARLCNLKGTVEQNTAAMKMILELIVEYENVAKENMK